jgi:hypothetical protein
MNKTARILLIIFSIIALATILHFVPSTEKLLSRAPIIREFYNNTVLIVTTSKGRANVSVNGKSYGQTPLTIENLGEGRHLVELEKVTESEGVYEKQHFYVNLHRNTESIVDIEIAPDNFKSGYILFYASAPRNVDGKGYLTVQSDLNNYVIFLNKESMGNQSSHQLTPGEYLLRVEAKGYESIEFPVIVREGYNLNTKVYLLPIPINFE